VAGQALLKTQTYGFDRFCDQLLRVKDGDYAGPATPVTAA
jgi:hypothetical protein